MARIGVNDSKTPVCRRVAGKRVWCPHYRAWRDMLDRCYTSGKPAYEFVHVCNWWHTFSNFLEWSKENYVEGFQLDKDFIGDGTMYSPTDCVFIPPYINSAFAHKDSINGLALGVSLKAGKFYAQISVDSKRKALGYFTTELQAYKAWANAKIEQVQKLLDRYRLERYASQQVIQVLEAIKSRLISSVTHDTTLLSIKG